VSAAFDLGQRAAPSQARVARGAAEESGIEIVKLPFGSPELNPLEDLWRSLKAVVAANRAYGSVEELWPSEQWSTLMAYPTMM
jgi:transposase